MELYNLLSTGISPDVLTVLIFVNLGVLTFLIPFVISRIVGIRWGKIHNSVFIPLTIVYIVMLILSFVFDKYIVFYTIMNAVFYGSLLYALCTAVLYMKKIRPQYLRLVVGIFVLLSVVFAPFFFMDTYYFEMFHVQKESITGHWALPLYYFWWNVSVLAYLIVYFYKHSSFRQDEAFAEFLKTYHITNREQEIIALILKGKSNQEISYELMISPSTVNNHMTNIYEKTGFKSRFELITLTQRSI